MVTPNDDARRGWPPELLNNDPGGFAWGVWHDRTPRLIAQVRDANPYGPDQRGRLDELREEIKRLRRELRRAELEREILKKATAYFAKESL